MPRSNSLYPISFNVRNRTRDLTDPVTIGNLNYAFNSLDKLTDPTTTSILSYSVNNLDKFTDPIVSNLGCTTDLNTANFL